jgi:hypothetical protein
MKEGALFIGWGSPIAGREIAGLDVFKEAKEFYEGLLKRGEITGFEPVLLSHVGGPLYGFFLLRGESTKLAKLITEDGFVRLSTKASLVCEKVAIVPAFVGDSVAKMIETYRTEVNTLALQHQHV